jgi:TetR/AcrR family transcriptional regulator
MSENRHTDEPRARNAERSRREILRAAEHLLAERGFEGVSLSDIATAANLSRGTPSYFFKSKEGLYEAVLEQVFREREEATRTACRPLVEWAGSDAPGPLRGAMTAAFAGYLDFLMRRPSFVKLIQREELAGASRLRRVPRQSKAIEDAFDAVRKVAPARGLKTFRVNDAVLLFVCLAFSPLALHSTLMPALGQDMTNAATRHRHSRFAVDQLLQLVGSDGS